MKDTDDELHEILINIPVPKVGAPTKYTPDACQAIINAAAEGEHIHGMMIAAGANSKTTYYAWQKEHAEFKEACEYAKVVSQAFWEKLGLFGTLGKIRGFNATSWLTTMNNKFSEDYSRTGTTQGGTTNINFNTVNLSDEQKITRIKSLMQKLAGSGINIGTLIEHQND